MLYLCKGPHRSDQTSGTNLALCHLTEMILCEGGEEDVRRLIEALRAHRGLQEVDLSSLLANGCPVNFDHWTIPQTESDDEKEDYMAVEVTPGAMEDGEEIQLGTVQMLSSIRIED